MAHTIARIVLGLSSLTMLLIVFAVANAGPMYGLRLFVLFCLTVVSALGLFLAILAD
jgi:hypothetical protein